MRTAWKGQWWVRQSRGRWWRALVALCEETKRVDLMDKVGHAGPATEPEPNHQDPANHKCVDYEWTNPPADKFRGHLHGILQFNSTSFL